jgi:hypothetical protein
MCIAISNCDLHWAAGFIDADGTVNNCSRSVTIAADQKDPHPLNKLAYMFGGNVYPYTKKGETFYRWYLYADKAVVVMKTLYSLFSPRRQNKIDECLDTHNKRKPRSWHNTSKTHCKRGHELSGSNLYTKKDGGRQCRECQRVNANAHYLKSKNKEI